jgi:hypothetical protein
MMVIWVLSAIKAAEVGVKLQDGLVTVPAAQHCAFGYASSWSTAISRSAAVTPGSRVIENKVALHARPEIAYLRAIRVNDDARAWTQLVVVSRVTRYGGSISRMTMNTVILSVRG